MENTIKVFNYIDDGEFELLYEDTTSLIRDCDYDIESNSKELLELLKLLFIKNNVSLPKSIDGVIMINDDKKIGIENSEGKLSIDVLNIDNLCIFMEWYCTVYNNDKENGFNENITSEHSKNEMRKESLQSAIKILEVINKPELSYALNTLTEELENDYIKISEEV